MGKKICLNCGYKYKTKNGNKVVQNCVNCTKRFDDSEAQRIIREALR